VAAAYETWAKFIYREHLLDVPDGNDRPSTWIRLADKIHSTINPCIKSDQPKMHRATRAMLDDYFSTQNAGLSKLLDMNVDDRWYHSRKDA
jgi:hypothetical protein